MIVPSINSWYDGFAIFHQRNIKGLRHIHVLALWIKCKFLLYQNYHTLDRLKTKDPKNTLTFY